jgi:predicted nucleic acid-binding protein
MSDPGAVRRVFVDTSAFFAHLVAEDAHHPDARALFERADREAWTLITTICDALIQMAGNQ